MCYSNFFPKIFDFKNCLDLEIRVRGHSRSLEVVPFDRLVMVSIATLIFWDIRLKVVENNTIRWTVFLTFYSNDEPIPYRFRYKRRFHSKIVIFTASTISLFSMEWFRKRRVVTNTCLSICKCKTRNNFKLYLKYFCYIHLTLIFVQRSSVQNKNSNMFKHISLPLAYVLVCMLNLRLITI